MLKTQIMLRNFDIICTIFLALVVLCVARPQVVTDTPEVQAAKKRFFEAFDSAAAAVASAPSNDKLTPVESNKFSLNDLNFIDPTFNIPSSDSSNPPVWIGPLASAIPAWVPGYEKQVRNTPEVEAATAEFNRAFRAQLVAINAFRNPKGLGFDMKNQMTWYDPNAPAGNQHIVL